MKGFLLLAVTALCCSSVIAQPFLPGQGVGPTGNLLTTDNGGPYNLTLLPVQENEVKAGLAARKNYTDADIVDFLVNVECLEGLFDTWGTFGTGFVNNLSLGGPTPYGARKANLSQAVLPFMQEVALNEQGHALFTRHAGSTLPCPQVDFDGGFNALLGYAYGLGPNQTIADVFGQPFDPFLNDQNYVLSVLSLEELGATGNKGLTLLYTNPVLANGQAGLATSACSQATVERMLLWQMRNMTVVPFNETVQTVFARVSAARDSLDGPQFDDQGLVNTDPRTISVPNTHVNMVPTDIHGLTFDRTPQQIINIVTVGSPIGVGAFFPFGLLGAIGKAGPAGYNVSANGTEAWPARALVATEMNVTDLGPVLPPTTAAGPFNVSGELILTQDLAGPLDNGTYLTRGAIPAPNGVPNNANTTQVEVALNPARATRSGQSAVSSASTSG